MSLNLEGVSEGSPSTFPVEVELTQHEVVIQGWVGVHVAAGARHPGLNGLVSS